jgi:hypothetical protein
MNGISLLEKGEGRELLKKHCRKVGLPVRVIEELVRIELDQVGRVRRRGMFDRFDDVLSNLTTTTTDEG